MVVILLPDSGSRYLSKVFDDDWMRENGFLGRDWVDYRASDVLAAKGSSDLITVTAEQSMGEVVALFKQYGISQIPAVNEAGQLVGMVREVDVLKHLLEIRHTHSTR